MWVVSKKLVKRSTGRNEHSQAALTPTPRPPKALPQSCHRARIARTDDRIEHAYIDPQLKRVGRHDTEDLTITQTLFDVSTTLWQITASIALNEFGWDLVASQPVTQIFEHHLNAVAALAKNDGGHPCSNEIGRQLNRRLDITLADTQLSVDHRRIVEKKLARTRRRAALRNQLHLAPQHMAGMLLGIAYRGRCKNELGIGSMKTSHPLKTPQDIGEM